MDDDINRPAPGELWRVQRFVNTFDLEAGTDELSGTWLVAHGLADTAEVDLGAVRAFREDLRGVLAADEPAPELGGVVTVRVSSSGVRIDGDGPVARVLAIVAVAAADGTWERLKVCGMDDCRWAFYDGSRNHSRAWCSMRGCGNRAKARAYRARQTPKAAAKAKAPRTSGS